jgi:hypothetical protein
MPKQGDEKVVAAAEVVIHPGIGEPDPLGDGPHPNRFRAAFDEQLRRGVEDQLLGLFSGPADSLLGHRSSLP